MYLQTLEEVELLIQNAIKFQATELYLSFACDYKSIIPDSIGDISSLEYLLADGGRFIKEIPTKNLEILNISGNEDLHQLPESIGKLHRLTTLDLEGGYLRALPESIGELQNLREINAQNNLLEFLPESIGNLTQLEDLNLMNNRLTQLPESIGNLSGVKYDIYLYVNPLVSLPKSVAKLPIQILWDGSIE